MGDGVHDDCVKRYELDAFVAQMTHWQEQQNGSLQRLEDGIEFCRKGIMEICQNQQQFISPFLTMMEKEADRRREDVTGLDNRVTSTEESIENLRTVLKIPGWFWKGLFALVSFVLVVVSILVALRVV